MLRFHLLALSHTKLGQGYSACAFTRKCELLARMLFDRGHTVYVYAPEGSQAQCTGTISVLDDATFQSVHGTYSWQTDGFKLGRDNVAYETFRRGAVAAIRGRCRPGDFLLCPFGLDHAPIADDLADQGLIVVESGIGYNDCFAPHRVYESHAWMHVQLGKEGRHLTPSFYDAVIPNAYDLADYPFPPPTIWVGHKPYFFFIARPNHDKGLSIARGIAAAVGIPLYTAGQGTPEQWAGTDNMGVLSAEDRNIWMANARAVLCPSLYVEPWCNVAVEAQLNGCPVICTDWGAFTENVVHGVTGYRCHTLPEFIGAARRVHELDRSRCRQWAEQYSLEHIGARYADYFQRLAGVYGGEAGDWYGQRVG